MHALAVIPTRKWRGEETQEGSDENGTAAILEGGNGDAGSGAPGADGELGGGGAPHGAAVPLRTLPDTRGRQGQTQQNVGHAGSHNRLHSRSAIVPTCMVHSEYAIMGCVFLHWV